MNILKLKNGNLQFIVSLLDFPKYGKEARMKNRFFKLLVPRLQEIEKERLALLEKYAEKKEGKPVIKDDKYDIKPENMGKFTKEYVDYLNEDFVIDILPSNKEEIKCVEEMLKNTSKEISTEEGMAYDFILTAFENTQ